MKRFAQAAVTAAGLITMWSALTATDYAQVACAGFDARGCVDGRVVKASHNRAVDCLRAIATNPMQVCAAGCRVDGSMLRCRRICTTETC